MTSGAARMVNGKQSNGDAPLGKREKKTENGVSGDSKLCIRWNLEQDSDTVASNDDPKQTPCGQNTVKIPGSNVGCAEGCLLRVPAPFA